MRPPALIVLIVAGVYGGADISRGAGSRHVRAPCTGLRPTAIRANSRSQRSSRTALSLRSAPRTPRSIRIKIARCWKMCGSRLRQAKATATTTSTRASAAMSQKRETSAAKATCRSIFGSRTPLPARPSRSKASLEVNNQQSARSIATRAKLRHRHRSHSGLRVARGEAWASPIARSDSMVRVEHSVEFDLAPPTATGDLPISATGSEPRSAAQRTHASCWMALRWCAKEIASFRRTRFQWNLMRNIELSA